MEPDVSERKPKLLITGGLGFVGSQLVRQLVAQDQYEVHPVERYVTGRYANLGRTVETHFVDLRDANSVRTVLKRVQPDVVVHMAAISPVSYSYEHPQEVIENNLMGTVNLAESCRELIPSFKHFVYAGTTEEYGATPERPAKETSRCIPNSPYSISKYAGSKYLEYMHLAYDFPATIIRCTNTYGRTNDTHFFIEKIVTQMIANPKGEVMMGDDEAIREFMYIDDHVGAYLSVLSQREKSIGEIFNFSTGKPLTLNEVIKLAARLTHFEGELAKHSIPKRPLDITDHSLNSDKARETLGWSANVPLETGLKKTIAFWRQKLGRPAG
ncbi:MAG: NAD-dependent epimerase/dehydratase family protein [Nitrososphaerota archaeon]|nr:NAD-dependent epimerase/dehydratase family protein [Nitrososphaerota archaeon]